MVHADRLHGDAADERPAFAQVIEHPAVRLPAHLGMLARDDRVRNDDRVVRSATDPDGVARLKSIVLASECDYKFIHPRRPPLGYATISVPSLPLHPPPTTHGAGVGLAGLTGQCSYSGGLPSGLDRLVDFGLSGGELGGVLFLVDLLGELLVGGHQLFEVAVGGAEHAEVGERMPYLRAPQPDV